MPITMPTDTRALLGADAAECGSRSLFMSRFAYPDAKDTGDDHPRRDWFNKLCGKPAWPVAAGSRSNWLAQTTSTGKGQILYTQLQSRLMVNMAGGVMENAGLCLDRFGLPLIPGSSVKGSARRAALAALHEWCETGIKPTGDDNLFTAVCASFNSPAEMLSAIARVFGWGEEDWDISKLTKEGRVKSDFAWAVGETLWPEVIIQCARALLRKELESPKDFGHFAGSVSFLPAYPVDLCKTGNVDGLPLDVPVLGKLELDIVTCHHGDYYAGDIPVATDTEEPVPVVFPAVAAGHIFACVLRPLRACDEKLLTRARACLATGLATFGLGAKTAAGYGWFDTSDITHKTIADSLEKTRRDREEAEAKAKQEAAEKAKQEEAARRKKALAEKLAQLTPEQQEDTKVEALTDDQFRSALDNYAKRGGEEQKAIVRAMRHEPNAPGSRRGFWDDLKAKAQKKGGKYAQTEQAIRQLSKQMSPGKEGKMP